MKGVEATKGWAYPWDLLTRSFGFFEWPRHGTRPDVATTCRPKRPPIWPGFEGNRGGLVCSRRSPGYDAPASGSGLPIPPKRRPGPEVFRVSVGGRPTSVGGSREPPSGRFVGGWWEVRGSPGMPLLKDGAGWSLPHPNTS